MALCCQKDPKKVFIGSFQRLFGASPSSQRNPWLDDQPCHTRLTARTASAAVKAEGLSTVFVEPQLSPAAGKRIASATGAKVATLDPLGSGDWFAMMEANRRAIAAAVGGKIDVSATEGGRTEQR